jgi:integrase/recombinase XerD
MVSQIEAYLNRLEVSGATHKTLCAYRYPLNLFSKSCRKEIASVTEDDLVSFVSGMRRSNLADRTCFNYLNVVKIFLKTHGLQFKLSVSYVEPEVDSYTRREVKAMLAIADYKMALVIRFLLGTGTREGEAMHAEFGDIDFGRKLLRVRPKPQWGWKPKTSECRLIPIPDSLLESLRELKQAREEITDFTVDSNELVPVPVHSVRPVTNLIFPNAAGAPDGHLLRKVQQVAKRAGVENASLHRFRRSFATLHHDSGVSARTVQTWLGHKDLATTMRYLASAELESESTRTMVNSTFGGL